MLRVLLNVTGIERLRGLVGTSAMPMAEQFNFVLVSAEHGKVVASAKASEQHHNPFHVVQGGFASAVLDMALGLVGISMLEEGQSVATTDLSVRYIRPLRGQDGIALTAIAGIVHAGRRVIVAEARLVDDAQHLYATAQSTSLVLALP